MDRQLLHKVGLTTVQMPAQGASALPGYLPAWLFGYLYNFEHAQNALSNVRQ